MHSAEQFCSICGRHYVGERSVCPADGSRLLSIPSDQLRIGAVVDGRYGLQEELAVGGMAAIYRVVDRDERREIALKLLQPRFLSTPRLADMFYQEARVIRRIHHPNVVELYDFGRTREGYLYIAMELLRGRTLAEQLWEVGLPSYDSALRIFFQIIDALRAAHEEGVIHADLKASNVVFVGPHLEDERVKVLDFGIARLYDKGPWRMRRSASDSGAAGGGPSSMSDSLVGGTPQYMSPEQIEGEEIDPRTDLYAAGVLLFQLLAGAVPFDADDPLLVCRMQREQPPPRFSEVIPERRIPRPVENLVRWLLRKDPEERPKTATEVYDATKDLLRKAGSPTQPHIVSFADSVAEAKGIDSFAADGLVLDDLPGSGSHRNVAVPSDVTQPIGLVETGPAAGALRSYVTLLDVEFKGDTRPFTLLDRATVELAYAPLVDACVSETRRRQGVVLSAGPFHLRLAFGFAKAAREGAAAVDVALALLGRVAAVEATLGVGLAARCGVASGPAYHTPEDRLQLSALVRGSEPDVAARLVQHASWGGVVLDGRSYRNRASRLAGAVAEHVRVRRQEHDITVFRYTPTPQSNSTPTPTSPPSSTS